MRFFKIGVVSESVIERSLIYLRLFRIQFPRMLISWKLGGSEAIVLGSVGFVDLVY